MNYWIYLMLEDAGNHAYCCIHSEKHYSFIGPNRTSKAELAHQTNFVLAYNFYKQSHIIFLTSS